MISENAKQYCKDDISKIENYELAIADTEHMWDCHHRLELTLDGEHAHTPKELKRLGMYYNRPYFELIFLTKSEHNKLHRKTEYAKQQKSKTMKGKTRSEFGEKFRNHFGIKRSDNIKLYKKEHNWYCSHNNKCRWE